MATSKKKREINLKVRSAEVTNLNFQPEKSGDDLVERVDLSITFVAKDAEIAELLDAKSNPLKLLWHKDNTVMFREISTFAVSLEAEGTLLIGISDEHMLEFENAKLKKITIAPHIELQAEIKCQVRLDPTGYLETLGQIRIHQSCVFGFVGAGIEKGAEKQQALDV